MGKRNSNEANDSIPLKKRKCVFMEETEPETLDKSTPNGDTFKSRSGIIESIYLKNFMCHREMNFKFVKNVHFIIGRNGSGKSAILTAIVIGLGGKANATSRGTNFKGLIETGKNFAEISVVLKNTGPDAYEVDTYGSSITITRRITVDGISTYKIKNSSGTIVSNKREELSNILDHYNIQVDNPVVILNQETSRNFLHGKGPKEKYAFFMKATQLEDLKHKYIKTDEQCKIAEDAIHYREKLLPAIQKEVQKYEKKYRRAQSLKDIKEKIKNLQHEILWCFINEDEKKLESIKSKIEAEQKLEEDIQRRIARCETQIQKLTAEIESLNEESNKVMAEVEKLKPSQNEFKTTIRNKRDELRNVENSLKMKQKDSDSLAKEGEFFQKRIGELKAVDQEKFQLERLKRLERIDQLSEKESELHMQKSTSENHLHQLRCSSTDISTKLHEWRNDQCEFRDQIKKIRNALHDLEASKTNQMQKFGKYIPRLLEKIESAYKQRQFKKKPRGPLGSLIHLKNPKWGLAIETCLGQLLNSFCVDNHKDEKTLRKLMSEVMGVERKPSIIVNSFQDKVYDYSRNALRSNKYPSVLDMLVISDPVVANCLIDLRSIESIALIESNPEARKVMLYDAQHVPKNCIEAFTISGDQLFPAPHSRYYSSQPKNKVELLKASVDEQIEERKQEINELESRIEGLEVTVREHNSNLLQTQRLIRQEEQQINKIRNQLQTIMSEIKQLKEVEEPEPLHVELLESELDTVKQREEASRSELERFKKLHTELKNELKNLQLEMEKVENIIQKQFVSMGPIREKIENRSSRRENIKDEKKSQSFKVKEQERKIKVEQENLKEIEKEIQSKLKRAQSVNSKRVRTTRTAHTIKAELDQLELLMKQEAKTEGDIDKLTEQYHATKKKFEKIKMEIESLKNHQKSLRESMAKRHKMFLWFRKQLVMRVKLLFVTSLQSVSYVGNLSFDFARESLEITVKNAADVDAQMGKENVQGLSGGERSFSTVCFVLALWDIMESPFRIMDEFDIFMDMGKRRISLELILDTTKQKVRTQYILFTPQEMPGIRALKDVHITMMPEPERRKSANIQESLDSEGVQNGVH